MGRRRDNSDCGVASDASDIAAIRGTYNRERWSLRGEAADEQQTDRGGHGSTSRAAAERCRGEQLDDSRVRSWRAIYLGQAAQLEHARRERTRQAGKGLRAAKRGGMLL